MTHLHTPEVAYSDYDAMLADEEVDAVIVAIHELPSARLEELTPKAEDEGCHAQDARTAIAGFLGRVFTSAQEEATRKEAARR